MANRLIMANPVFTTTWKGLEEEKLGDWKKP